MNEHYKMQQGKIRNEKVSTCSVDWTMIMSFSSRIYRLVPNTGAGYKRGDQGTEGKRRDSPSVFALVSFPPVFGLKKM